MLSAVRHVVGDNFVFQQDIANRTRVAWNTWFHFCRAMGLPTVRTWTSLITTFGSHAAACVWDADPQCWRTQAATGWCLERAAAKCCRRCCQQVEKASLGMCSHEGRILWTSAVGCFDNVIKL